MSSALGPSPLGSYQLLREGGGALLMLVSKKVFTQGQGMEEKLWLGTFPKYVQ